MKDETTINSYELTLTPNYVSDWNFNDALRELIQNGTDQEVLDPDNEFQIDYSQKEKVLRLKNRKSVLKINTLLLGGGYRESAPAEIAIEQTGRMRIKHCMNGTIWTAHVQPWTNTRSRRRRQENNGRS